MTMENDLVERRAADDCPKEMPANWPAVLESRARAGYVNDSEGSRLLMFQTATLIRTKEARIRALEAELARKTEAHWKDISTAPEGEIILVSDGETRWFATIPNPQLDEIEAWMETLVPGDPYRKKTPKWWMETGLPRAARSALEEKTDV